MLKVFYGIGALTPYYGRPNARGVRTMKKLAMPGAFWFITIIPDNLSSHISIALFISFINVAGSTATPSFI